jgi:quercetin dioxygenase-like cupin family protein
MLSQMAAIPDTCPGSHPVTAYALHRPESEEQGMSDQLVGMHGYETFNLREVVSRFPPDPDSAARHRAEILVKSDTLRAVLVTALSGGTLHDHSAPGPITIHVIEGSFLVTINGDRQTISADEVMIMAPGVPHSVECIEDGAFLLTIAHLSRTPDRGGDS